MSLVSEKKLLENTHQLADNHEKLTRGVFCVNVFQYLHVSSSQTYVMTSLETSHIFNIQIRNLIC